MSDTLSSSHPAIADLSHCIGHRVTIHGFVDAIRDQKRMRFIVLRDKTGKVQLAQSKQGSALTEVEFG
ncbi:OB-fold nucleic acid binding domain-containing protein [Rhizobium ruizarguesonis]|uniref:OB-fold nucleic acid binding domain-containing protein n=1 Tax=Rhizobium ruizarguesonis TaxID=2081791 RepID=UPI0010317486|nr:OB-fold nucleic acid binding domain-containing protein [Rhizobium ruizarguesonis]TAU57452.1 hypothetical protein ELI46_39605 [Rhizobium ruizarguesonis]